MPGGRPSKFQDTMVEQAYRLCLLGATDADLAQSFEVDEATINRWKQDHPEFCESLNAGKEEADAKVASRLVQRAMGYSHEAVQINVLKDGTVIETPYVKHYPPDTTACIFWLKNRQSARWRDKHEMEHSGTLSLEQMITESFSKPAEETE